VNELTLCGARRPRLALLAGDKHPLTDCERHYEQLDTIAASVGCDWRAFHTVATDPREAPMQLRPRVGTGVLVAPETSDFAQDVARFQATAPAAVAALVDELRELWDCPAASVLARPDVRQAFAIARWIQAYAPCALITIGHHHDSFRAVIASRLLGLATIAILDDPDLGDPAANLLSLHLFGATVIHATNSAVATQLERRFAPALAGKTLRRGVESVADAVACAMASTRSPDALRLGGLAAFGPLAPVVDVGAPIRRFTLLGAERTGSNLLMGMLGAHPQVVAANELFNRREIADGVVAWPARLGSDQAALAAERARSPAALLARLADESAAVGATLCGFKLMYGHALADERIVEAIASDPRHAVVHLRRRDRLQRWRSHVHALWSDRWFGGEREDERRVELPVVETASDFVVNEALEARYRAAFAGLPMVELDYEDLLRRLPDVSRQIGALLGVDFGELRPRTHKTGPQDPAAGIANCEELRAAFAGTRWASLIP
jgi:LPS sulfotransferase NodH